MTIPHGVTRGEDRVPKTPAVYGGNWSTLSLHVTDVIIVGHTLSDKTRASSLGHQHVPQAKPFSQIRTRIPTIPIQVQA